MRLTQFQSKKWNTGAAEPPDLTSRQWYVTGALGAVLIIMALLQLINFSDFRDGLGELGLNSPGFWAVVIIIAELAGAVGFFRLKLSNLFRAVSSVLAISVTLFWFVLHLQAIANGYGEQVGSSYFFGGFLNIEPGWWSTFIVTVLLFWTLYAVTTTQENLARGSSVTVKRERR